MQGVYGWYPVGVDIEDFLRRHGIVYEKFEHRAVFTCEEAEQLPPMPGMGTKNLFLRDKKGKRHFLVCLPYDKKLSLKDFAERVGVQGVSLASPERLRAHLGVEAGSVTIIGLVNDTQHAVELWIDEELWQAALIHGHPLRNTATLSIPHEGVVAFLQTTGHEPHVAMF
jgi:Ala-tRNA(Pro) deacylase